MSEHAPFDLVVYKDERFLRVQVKSRRIDKNGGFTIGFRSSYSTSKGVQTIRVDKNDIDLYCVYCLDNDACYYFNPNDYNLTVSFRVRMPKNNQTVKIKFADDFREVP